MPRNVTSQRRARAVHAPVHQRAIRMPSAETLESLAVPLSVLQQPFRSCGHQKECTSPILAELLSAVDENKIVPSQLGSPTTDNF